MNFCSDFFCQIYIFTLLFSIAIAFLFGIITIINLTAYFTYFWQLKEYRLDRMREFLSTKSGREKLFPKFYLIKLCILALVFIVIIGDKLLKFGGSTQYIPGISIIAFLLFWTFFLIEIIDLFKRFASKTLFRPEITIKALIVMVLTISASFLLMMTGYILYSYKYFELVFAIFVAGPLLTPIFNGLIVLAFWPITELMKNRVLKKARAKIAVMQGLKVIGITGSYGKSSTKEFLAKILEDKYLVLKTPGNTNTEIGVAGVVLKDLKESHQVFIVEMGAYRIGEIKKICDLVAPRIGIITAVKDAHLGLFGSLENIKKAKFELIEGLPEFGTGIFNLDNAGSMDLLGRASKLSQKLKVMGYGYKENLDRSELKLANLQVKPEQLSFELNGVKFQVNVYGEQNISNLMGAILAAKEMGMSLEEIAKAAEKIEPNPRTMNLKKATEDLWIVDDTYNANPDGVIAGLNYLNLFADRVKVIVFPGMIELGEKAFDEHVRVAEKIGGICDYAIFTSKDFEEPILKGLNNSEENQYIFIENNQEEVWKRLKEELEGRKSVVLFVSRGSGQVIEHLNSKVNVW